MKRDIVGMMILLSCMCLLMSYLGTNLYTSLGFLAFVFLVYPLLDRIFDALKWPRKSDFSRKETHITVAVPAIIGCLSAFIVTRIFPPEKERKPEAALTLPQLEEPRTAQPPAEAKPQPAEVEEPVERPSAEPEPPGVERFGPLPEGVVEQVNAALAGLSTATSPEAEEMEIDWDSVRLEMLEAIPDEEARAATAAWMLEVDQFMEGMTPSDANWIEERVREQMANIEIPDGMSAEQRAVVRKTIEMQAASVRMQGAPVVRRMREEIMSREEEMREALGETGPRPRFQFEEENR
ncbi:MAG: hypothetical protein M2R45_00141 [Verrucomicrobia subdivision 3 bacterium]|nr:hypothetical protein [Limisphaerales bacterium]MCS1412399.1 hypothetical protein [Limisphaerales bacterium]